MNRNMEMDQYLLIPFLGEWTSIYQLFWCSPGVQGFDTLPYGDVNNQWIWVKSSTKDGGHNRMHMFASSSRHCYLPSISTCTTRLAVVDRSVRTKMKGTILCNICIMYIYIVHILYIYCTYIVHLLYIYCTYIFTYTLYGLHLYMCTKIDILRTCSFISSRDLRFGAIRQLEAPPEPSRTYINNNDDDSNHNIVHNIYIYICICVYIYMYTLSPLRG